MQRESYELGMIGLGTMGRNLLLNMSDHGFAVAGHDRDTTKVDLLEKEKGTGQVKGFTELSTFISHLKKPRAVMLLVPAGAAVDAVISDLLPLLDKGDLIIDGGNSHFKDTNRRAEELKEKRLHFFGMGVSGGEEGARRGPSMMPGGDLQAYEVVKPVFEAIAARVQGQPCVAYMGPGSAGHFVKMVHNGIEYSIMQLIAETYAIMQHGLGFSNEDMYEVFKRWNEGRLKSFLIEITRDIFAYREPGSKHLLLDEIKDEARSKGTGKWTSQVAMDLQVPLTAIDSAVSMRDLSKYKNLRLAAQALYPSQKQPWPVDRASFTQWLEDSLYFSIIIAYAQGVHLLTEASREFRYELSMETIAQVWRGGCIIRSAFLEDMYQAYHQQKDLTHLLLDKSIAAKVSEALPGTRAIVAAAASSGLAIPAYMASLSYFDTFRSGRMPSNLIQAQRDYFGAHTYERIGKEGVFHAQWTSKGQ